MHWAGAMDTWDNTNLSQETSNSFHAHSCLPLTETQGGEHWRAADSHVVACRNRYHDSSRFRAFRPAEISPQAGQQGANKSAKAWLDESWCLMNTQDTLTVQSL